MGDAILFDHQIFYLINREYSNVLFDALLPVIRDKKTWIPLYIGLCIFLIKSFRKKGLYVIMFLVISIGLGDLISARIFKPSFERARPCHDKSIIKVRAIESWQKTQSIFFWIPKNQACGPGYSFISSHATNHFALATTLGLILFSYGKWILLTGWLWAFLISYAQVYIGVHFPSDILIGSLLGVLIGLLLNSIWSKYFNFDL